MTKNYRRVFKLENAPSEFVETPIVHKMFRVTIDVEATLTSRPQGGMMPPSPEDVSHTERLAGVMVRGRWLPAAELWRMREDIETAMRRRRPW